MTELAIGGHLDIDLGTVVAVEAQDFSSIWVKTEVRRRTSG